MSFTSHLTRKKTYYICMGSQNQPINEKIATHKAFKRGLINKVCKVCCIAFFIFHAKQTELKLRERIQTCLKQKCMKNYYMCAVQIAIYCHFRFDIMLVYTSTDLDYGVIFGPIVVQSSLLNPRNLIGLLTEEKRNKANDTYISVRHQQLPRRILKLAFLLTKS